jgi:hypothetical protein
MLVVATVGGQTLLEAVQEFLPYLTPSRETDTETVAEKLKADGGMVAVGPKPDTCPNGYDFCGGPAGDVLPCFPCLETKNKNGIGGTEE